MKVAWGDRGGLPGGDHRLRGGRRAARAQHLDRPARLRPPGADPDRRQVRGHRTRDRPRRALRPLGLPGHVRADRQGHRAAASPHRRAGERRARRARPPDAGHPRPPRLPRLPRAPPEDEELPGRPHSLPGAAGRQPVPGREAGAAEFSDQDQRMVEMLASRAAVAIETVKLYAGEAAQRAWLRSIIDQMPEGVMLLNESGGIRGDEPRPARPFVRRLGGRRPLGEPRGLRRADARRAAPPLRRVPGGPGPHPRRGGDRPGASGPPARRTVRPGAGQRRAGTRSGRADHRRGRGHPGRQRHAGARAAARGVGHRRRARSAPAGGGDCPDRRDPGEDARGDAGRKGEEGGRAHPLGVGEVEPDDSRISSMPRGSRRNGCRWNGGCWISPPSSTPSSRATAD